MKKMLIMFSLLLVCAVYAQTATKTPACLEKKLIEYGWDFPSAQYVADNITKMEEQPFDGVIFRLESGYNAFVLDDIDEEKFAADYAACEKIQASKFTDNFVIMLTASEQDWFNDEHWAIIEKRLKMMTHAAKLANCVGVCFDHEPYGFNPWSYKKAAHHDTKSFEEYEIKVRERGAQFIRALESEMPGLVVLSFFQLCYFVKQLKNMDPAERARSLSNEYYAFLPAFLNGMLDAATPEATFIDGNEVAYYYQDPTPYFFEYHCVRNLGELLVDPVNHFKYRNQVKVGQALYMDQYYDKRTMMLVSRFMPLEEQNLWLEHNTYWSCLASDKYVWCYSERMNWWTDTDVPAGSREAILSARRKLQNGEPLGFDMHEIFKRATAALEAEQAKAGQQ